MRKRNVIGAVALVVIVALALVACGAGERTTGRIDVRLGASYAKTIEPPISLVCAEYVLTGDGPGAETFGPVTVTGDTTFDRLVPGSWTVTAVGQNAEHDAIGEGSGTVTVVIGQSRSLSITVTEYASPDGSYRLDLSWEPDIVDFPVWTGSLKDAAAVVTAQAFTTDEIACTATSTTTGLHPGWYANVVRLFDAPTGLDGTEVLSTGFAEAVRIAAGRETYGDVELHAVQGYGELEINLTPDFLDPLVLTPTPSWGSATVYSGQANVFAVTADRAATFVWYLRGTQVAVGDSFDLDAAPLTLGERYRLDVIGFSVDGKHAGSGTWDVVRDNVHSAHYILSEPGDPGVIVFGIGASDGIVRNFYAGNGGPESTVTIKDVPAGTYRVYMNTIQPVYWTGTTGSHSIGDAAVVTFPKAGDPYLFDFGGTW